MDEKELDLVKVEAYHHLHEYSRYLRDSVVYGHEPEQITRNCEPILERMRELKPILDEHHIEFPWPF